MLKTVKKQKNVLLFLATFIATFSILFGGLLIGGPALADDDPQDPPDQDPPETSETSSEPGQVVDDGTDEDYDDDDETGDGDDEDDDDDDEDGVSDDDEHKLSRKLEVDTEDNKVKIESELKYGENKDEYKVEIKGEEDLRIKYEYESEAGSEESEIELEVRFKEIVEYNDTDGDGFNETDILATHPLEDFSYTLNPFAESDTGENLYEINATSAISEDGGVFKVRVLAPENFTIIYGEQNAPTTLKIDIEILNFPYTDPDSLLALKTKVELETSASIGYMEDIDENLEGVSTTIGEYTIEFTWASTATVDQESDLPVGAKIFESEFEYESDDEDAESEIELKLYLLYPRGTHIIHDPKIGTPLSALPYAQGIRVSVPQFGIIAEKLQEVIPYISIANLLFGALVATLLVVPVPFILRRRRR